MNLIIESSLTCDEGLYFRFVSMVAKKDLNYDILVEAQRKDTDHYYHLLTSHGWFDFVDDFVEPRHRLEGVRIDTEWNYARTIKVAQIRCENTLNILGQLEELRKIKI